jgi:hypothetical protein
MVGVWEKLTSDPAGPSGLCYRLRGELELVTKNGKAHQRWQLKLNATHGARIWYYVEGKTVHLETVHTGHPNETK